MQMKTYVLVFLVMVALAPEAQSTFQRLTRVRGTVYCSTDDNVDVTSVPGFPFAKVELRCKIDGLEYEESEVRTNAAGLFNIVLLVTAQLPVPVFASNCYLRVPTDLSKCEADLPSDGHLISSMNYTGDTSEQPGNFTFSDFVPLGFHYIPSIAQSI